MLGPSVITENVHVTALSSMLILWKRNVGEVKKEVGSDLTTMRRFRQIVLRLLIIMETLR
jgi:hypothetical protein